MAAVERPDGQQRPALVHDLSESGALLLMRTTKIHIDDDVILHLYADDATGARTAHGRVVRVEEVAPGDSGPWLRRVGVQFVEPLRMHAADIEGLRRRAHRLGIG